MATRRAARIRKAPGRAGAFVVLVIAAELRLRGEAFARGVGLRRYFFFVEAREAAVFVERFARDDGRFYCGGASPVDYAAR